MAGQSKASTTNEGESPRNSRHGYTFQTNMVLMVSLLAHAMMKADPNFTCTISAENQQDGKFDDLVFKYRCHGSSYVLKIQAKHKENQDWKITEDALANDSTKAQFSIVKYFISFRNTREQDPKNDEQVMHTVSTNADLKDIVKQELSIRNQDTLSLEQHDVCYVFKLIGATCYSFNVKDRPMTKGMQKIFDLLKESSECYQLGKMLARTVYEKKEKLDFNTTNVQRFPLLVKYRKAILRDIVGKEKPSKTGVNDKRKASEIESCKKDTSVVYELNPKFCDGTLDGGFRVRKAFEIECRKLAKPNVDLWEDIKKQGITFKNAIKPLPDSPPDEASSNLPEDEVKDEEIVTFFEQFLLACASYSNDKLSQAVKDLWGKTFAEDDVDENDKVVAYSAMYVLISQLLEKNEPVKKNNIDIKNFFDHIRCVVKSWNDVRSWSRRNEERMGIAKSPLSIKQESATQLPLYKFLCQQEGTAIFPCRYQNGMESVSKVVMAIIEAFQATLTETEKYLTLFLDSAKLLAEKNYEKIQDVLRMESRRVIMVIVCMDERQKILEKLEPYKSACDKKIIIMQQTQANSSDDTFGGDLRVLDLIDECKEQMFPANKTLMLFGTKTLVGQLINEGDDLTKCLELLECLGQHDGEPCLVEQKYNEIREWYIQRQLQPYQSKNCEFFSNVRKCLAFTYFQNCGRMGFGAFYDTLKRELNLSDIHIKQIIDEHARGTANDPPELRGESQEVAKVHIVLDEAGFGKSTYLTWLGWYLRRKDSFQWIIRFNAIEYSSDFERIRKRSTDGGQLSNTMDETEALRVLFQLVHLALFVPDINMRSIEDTNRERTKAEQCSNLIRLHNGQVVLDEAKDKEVRLSAVQMIELRLFMAKFNSKQLVVLFDGFDEVVPYYKEIVFQLFSRWQTFEGIHKIYFTSRPYGLKIEFDTVFQEGVQFYRLMPFNKETRLISVHIFLRFNFKQYDLCEESLRFKLLGSLEAILRCYLAELRNTPLFISMGLDILCPLVQDHVDFVAGTISGQILSGINTNLEKLSMIEMFIKEKLKKSVEKVQTTDAVRKTAYALDNAAELNTGIHRMHCIVALHALFSVEERMQLLSEREEAEAKEYMEKVRRGSVKSGLIEGVVRHVPLFIHRVFAEYFAADWVYRCTIDDDTRFEKLLRFNHENPLSSSSRDGAIEFFDRMLIRDGGSKPIHLAAIDRSVLDIRTLLEDHPEMAHETDAGGRTFLHLLTLYTDDAFCERNTDELHAVFKLLDKSSINCRDRLRGWSALDYAILLDYSSLIPRLIEFGATVNVDTILSYVKTHGSTAEFVMDLVVGMINKLQLSGEARQNINEVSRQIVEYLVRELHNGRVRDNCRFEDIVFKYSNTGIVYEKMVLMSSLACKIYVTSHPCWRQFPSPVRRKGPGPKGPNRMQMIEIVDLLEGSSKCYYLGEMHAESVYKHKNR